MRRRELLLGLIGASAFAQSSARLKMNRLESDTVPTGWVNFSLKEVNTLAAETIAREMPGGGVTRPNVTLGKNSAIGSALVDFAKVREGTGERPGVLSRLLLGGEKDVSVEATFRTGGGMCTIDVVRVVISGFEIQGRLLDWLVDNYVLPLYPTAKVGTPFEIGFHVEHIEIAPSRVRLRIVR
jgi:hypothetical protein